MLDFNKWKLLNESLGGFTTLGLSSRQSVGGVQGAMNLEEKKKHMKGDVELGDEEIDDADDDISADVEADDDEDLGDEEETDDCGGMKFCGKNMKKKMKKKMKNECECGSKGKDVESDDDDEDMGGDEDMGDEEGGDLKSKKSEVPLGFMKKKMKKKMKKESVEDFMQSLYKGYASPKNQTDSAEAFWDDLSSYVYDPKQKFSDGFTEYKEDCLLTDKQDAPAAPSQPGPGEVGYAPQQKLGEPQSYEVPPLDEGKKPMKSWLSR